jgi:uncharacterized protein (TIGR03086 family)
LNPADSAELAASDIPAERFRRVAGRFSDCADHVPPAAWDDPAPCEGWVARDIVRHLVDWMPAFLRAAGVELPAGPSVDDDPAGAWAQLAGSIQALLDDPDIATREFDAGPPGRQTVESAVAMIVLGDIVIHTWDLAHRPVSTNHSTPTSSARCSPACSPSTTCSVRAATTDRRCPCPTTPTTRPS